METLSEESLLPTLQESPFKVREIKIKMYFKIAVSARFADTKRYSILDNNKKLATILLLPTLMYTCSLFTNNCR